MMNSILFASVVLSAIGGTSHLARAESSVHFYTVEITSAQLSLSGTDSPAANTAAILERRQSNACIDLRMLGSGSTNDKLNRGTLGLLTNQPLRPEVSEAIQKIVCGRKSPNCQVNVRSIRYATNELELSANGPPDENTYRQGKAKCFGRCLGEAGSYQKRVNLAGKDIPRMSRACASGNYQDAWNDAAGTKQARAFIKVLGFDVDYVRTFSLMGPGGKEVWGFGFPRHESSKEKP